jgi:very-short-patch-repair endonuclease/preprotein translocase subunit Sec61beta
LSTLTFALEQAGVPIISDVRVHNGTAEPIGASTLTLQLLPNLGAAVSVEVPALGPGLVATTGVVDLPLPPDRLRTVLEAERGQLAWKLVTGDRELAQGSEPVDLLAFNEWPGRRAPPALLAMFVTPNDPTVAVILRRVREHLEQETGSSALEGYQRRSRSRVRQMVASLYESLQSFEISYAEAPASFEALGQKVRFADRVLSDQIANCLDMSLLAASCLEQMGLRPLLVLIEGHAFPGVWLVDERFPECVVGDAARLRTSVELGELAFFDSSAIVASPRCSFTEAESVALGYLGRDEEFELAIDVRVARLDRYRPLPRRTTDVNEPVDESARHANATLDEAQPLPAPELSTAVPAATFAPAAPVDPVHTRLKRWSDRLLDLSLRNRLLNLRLDTKSVVPLDVPDAARFEDALAEEQSFDVLARPIDGRDRRDAQLVVARSDAEGLAAQRLADLAHGVVHSSLSETELRARAVHLDRTARLDLEEGGANTLYAAMGLLRWYESESSEAPRLAPLLLVPVTLEYQRLTRRVRVRGLPDDAVPNVTLVEKVRRDFAVDLVGLTNLEADEHGHDVPAMLRSVRQAVQRMPRWEVLDGVVLGLFTFSKFLMWRDLGDNAEALLESTVVSHIARGALVPFPNAASAVDPRALDDSEALAGLPLVVDADSTQMAAISSALTGRCFVLQGPPGTGKSQTITNLIAASLAEGKTVLFISEKMAALSVVERRLAQAGLGDFCLELHSNKAQKKAVVDAFGRSLARTPAAKTDAWQTRSAELQRERGELNAYARALHAPRPLGQSFYQASARLLALGSAPAIHVSFDNAAVATEAALRRLLDQAGAYAASASAVEPITTHPYRDAALFEWSAQGEAALRQALEGALAALSSVSTAGQALAGSASLPCPQALTDFEELCELVTQASLGPLPPALLDDNASADLARRTRAWRTANQALTSARAELATRWSEGLYGLDLKELSARFQRWASAFFLWSLIFLWGARSKLKSLTRAGLPTNPRITGDLALARSTLEQGGEIETERQALILAFAGGWSGEPGDDPAPLFTHAERLRAALRRYLAAARQATSVDRVLALAEPALSPERRRAVSEQARTLSDALTELDAQLATATQVLRPDASALPDRTSPAYVSLLHGALSRWHQGLGSLRAFCLYRGQQAAFAAWGAGPLIALHQAGTLRREDLASATERAFLQAWTTAIRDAEPALRRFDGANHHRLVERFRSADRAQLGLARQHVTELLEARIPRADGVLSEASETGKLQRELRKKARHLPVRKLLGELPNLAPRLKPCFLMSPLSVAQYLPAGGRKFDLVVFDEASQIGTHDAIGAIARGKQVVIVGDSKQLPPTSFFQRGASDDAPVDDNDIEELESILDEAIASGLPEQGLGWHYRSRHEALIDFSNQHYYEGQLNVFPAARGHVPDLGVAWHPVPNGSYDKSRTRTNRVEAESLIAHLLGALAQTSPGARSFGVVTFSLAQQLLMADLLDEARGKSAAVEAHFSASLPEPVFVKNLENVQGDERDEILFSVGYGPDEAGRVWMNFGPLNRSGGERRLNVAITRARQKLRVFSTLTHEQIDLSRTSATGARHLKAFLRYVAERGQADDVQRAPRAQGDFDSDFERQVHDALTAKGFKVACQVGCGAYRIDLAVVHPDEPGVYLLSVECDGASYHSAATARDRDRLRQEVLEGLGWRLHRVWSTDWWFRREHEVERLVGAIEAALSEPRPPPAPPAPGPIIEPEAVQATPLPGEPASPSPVIPYVKAVLAPLTLGPSALYDATGAHELRLRLLAILAVEAPIHVDELARTLGASFGQLRLSERLRARVLAMAKAMHNELIARGDFVWRADQDPATWSSIRGANEAGETRPLEVIAPEELAQAGAWVLSRCLSTTQADLVRETAKLFGVLRVTAKVTERLLVGIETLRASGRAALDGDRIEWRG